MRRAAALVAALVLVSGCALGEILADYGDPAEMTATSLVGIWWDGTTRLIEFRADGTLVANDLPVPVVDVALPADFDRSAPGADATGRWQIDVADGLLLDLDRVAGAPTAMAGPEISALRDDNGVVGLWFFYVGDGGNSWTVYHKV